MNTFVGKISIAEFKNPEEQALIKETAKKIMKEKTNVQSFMNCKSPLTNGFLTSGYISSEVKSLVVQKLRKTCLDEEMTEQFLCNTLEMLIKEACEHIDEDWNDFFTGYFLTPYGAKHELFQNQHPMLLMLKDVYPYHELMWTNEIADNTSEEEVLVYITKVLAEYNLGLDFYNLYNGDLTLLPSDLYNSLLDDAKAIMEEIKNSPNFVAFQEKKKSGEIPEDTPARMVCENVDDDGTKHIYVFWNVPQIYMELDIDSTGFTIRKHIRNPNGDYTTYLYDKEHIENVEVIKGSDQSDCPKFPQA